MDPHVWESALNRLSCTDKTHVLHLDSREAANDNILDEKQLLSKLSEFTNTAEDHQPAPFILITAKGDPIYDPNPLEISKNVLRSLVTSGLFLPQTITVFKETQSHFSHRIEYDMQSETPSAIHIFLRVPRLRKIINLVMRINLRTMSTIALLTSRLSSTLDDLRSRCLRQLDTLRAHPLHLLNFILEHRMRDLDDWVEDLWAYVGGLERRTGISNDWSGLERGGKESKLQGAEYAGLLQDLHTVSVELRLALATMKFAGDLGEGFKQLSRRLDETRKEASGEHMKKRVKVALEDQIEYNEVVVKTTRAKLGELLDRVQAQINVTYSLIAQKDSEQNIRIATLTAKDSQTMKTITILTLTFLPSTFLASLWSADIFTMDRGTSWRVYVGTTVALTMSVFALWWLYLWITKSRRPASADIVGEVEEKKEV
ncbi:hypothetical protein BU26DRAFT_516312 [Trematosphaeria pertusa]|uniref:Uncharacterized protein n=1 Tax=Trematosphaeria pertusa TaxID=390896 RepID=A0A6A6IUE4_9PLEO|nr:uncharacterized protein BU26DRAFT_516312 [Trematosphaeria pertusa]KAF2254074.1 hypothetical protein BU26DRAFT_516312 [Trematosphaeria pertusa]